MIVYFIHMSYILVQFTELIWSVQIILIIIKIWFWQQRGRGLLLWTSWCVKGLIVFHFIGKMENQHLNWIHGIISTCVFIRLYENNFINFVLCPVNLCLSKAPSNLLNVLHFIHLFHRLHTSSYSSLDNVRPGPQRWHSDVKTK